MLHVIEVIIIALVLLEFLDNGVSRIIRAIRGK